MAVEIERKFLVVGDAWRSQARRSARLVQGYLSGGPSCSIRIRIGEDSAWLNIKSAVAGVERREYEYAIPRADAESMLTEFCGAFVEKIRHYVPQDGAMFEVDEFLGDNAGMVIAELELRSVTEEFPHPRWLGREVSDLPRYYNLHLLQHPYSRWNARERAGD